MIEWLQWFITAPSGPGTPFGSPLLWLLDSMRLIIIGSSVVLAAGIPFVASRVPSAHLRGGLVALLLYAAVAAGTEFEHFGDYGHYRLFLVFVANVLSVWRLYGMASRTTTAPVP